jgi:L-asparagine transporter-like permease
MWRARDPFYPYLLIFWGCMAVLYVWRTLVYLSQLPYSVPLALTNEKGKEARSLIPYILGTALTGFCFVLCSLAIRPFGRLCTVGAIALAALTILMIWTTERKIKNVARGFYRPADELQI